MNNIPNTRLELVNMRHIVSTALMEYQALIDEQVQIALDKALAPEAIQAVIFSAVQSSVKSVITDEIDRAFSWTTPGRAAIRAAVEKLMTENYGSLE